ncbi:MAG: hypothetical protein RIS92_924 [Verrucomicrobiota bacterium]
MGASQCGEAAFEGGAGRWDCILFGDEFADGQVAFLQEEELFEDGEHGCMKHLAGGQGKGNRVSVGSDGLEAYRCRFGVGLLY